MYLSAKSPGNLHPSETWCGGLIEFSRHVSGRLICLVVFEAKIQHKVSVQTYTLAMKYPVETQILTG